MTETRFSFCRSAIKAQGLISAAGAIVVCATAASFLGRFSWFFDLFSHFRVQYALALSVGAALLLFWRQRRTAAVFAVVASINLATFLPLYFGAPDVPGNASGKLRAMLINVNTHEGNPSRVGEAVKEANPDILVLEEISSRWVSELKWLENSYPHSVVIPRDDNFGIGLFSKLPIAKSEEVYLGEAEVPSIIAHVVSPETNLLVMATHPIPPIGRDYSRMRNEQLANIPELVRQPLPALLLGDLNVTPWNHHFRRLLANSGLRDSAKGFGVQATWPSGKPLLRIPLDHCLHSDGITIVERRIGGNVGSDHYPLVVDFVVAPHLR